MLLKEISEFVPAAIKGIPKDVNPADLAQFMQDHVIKGIADRYHGHDRESEMIGGNQELAMRQIRKRVGDDIYAVALRLLSQKYNGKVPFKRFA